MPGAADLNRSVMRVADLEMDPGRHWVRKAGEPVHLTPKEFELLAVLMRSPGAPVTHAKLTARGLGTRYGTNSIIYDPSSEHSARKLKTIPPGLRYILTEPWVGYHFVILTIQTRVPQETSRTE